MTDDDAILNAAVLYTEADVLAEFWECCEAKAEEPRPARRKTKELPSASFPNTFRESV
jgi:hypothetical protein